MSALVVNRRQALRTAALAAGAAVAGPAVVVSALPAAAAAPALSAASAAADPVPLRSLPLISGTPTDLARTATDTVWMFDSAGLVQVFDWEGDHWTQSTEQDWATVLTYGTARLARWGRPGGPNQVVLVFGSAPEPPPTTTTPTTPTTTAGSTGPTTSAGATGATTGTSSATPTPTSGGWAGGGSGSSGGSAAGSSGGADGELSYTGLNLGRLGLIAAGLLAAGGALLSVRRRRMSTGPASPPDPGDPANQPGEPGSGGPS